VSRIKSRRHNPIRHAQIPIVSPRPILNIRYAAASLTKFIVAQPPQDGLANDQKQ